MESSIAEFLERQLACELLPTTPNYDTGATWLSYNPYSTSTPLLDTMYSYLLGLLAMIKCSICSYQCDN